MKQQSSSSGTLHILLWVAQVLLAAFFLMAGAPKTFQPIAVLAAQLPSLAEMPAAVVRFIGISELLAAAGLVLPSLLRIKPGLTPLAAVALAFVMLLAAAFHLSRGEAPAVPMNILLGLVALFVAWGRSRKRPIPPKNSFQLN